MLNSLVLAILAFYAVPLGITPQAELETKLEKVVENYTVSESNFPRALIAVAMHFEIPMGIEWIELPAEPEKVTFSWKRAPVRQVIETIVKSRPGYGLEVGDQIVHVFYRGAKADKTNFLNIKVPEFEARNENVAFPLQRLQAIVNRSVAPPPPNEKHGGATVTYTTISYGDNECSFRLQNTTVRAILDQLALGTDGKVWAVNFRESAGLTPTGFRRIITLAVPHPQPTEPSWDLFVIHQWPYPN